MDSSEIGPKPLFSLFQQLGRHFYRGGDPYYLAPGFVVELNSHGLPHCRIGAR